MDVRHSRALRLAGGVSVETEETLLGRLESSRVAIAVGPGEASRQTAELLVDTLRRLPIELVLDPGSALDAEQIARIVAVAEEIDPGRGIEVGSAAGVDTLVAVGHHRPDATVAGMPINHGALVVSGRPLEGPAVGASGLGIFTCAAFLAGEVFKRVAAVRRQRATFPDRLAWCPVRLDDDPWSTPLLDGPPVLELALVGQGAIGTATARILALLGAEGRVQLVDPERFGPENLGTYSLGTAADAELGPWKVDLAAATLACMSVEAYVGTAADFIGKIDRGEARWPALVLTGLDSAAARREVQRLWPDRLIDGATGDTMCGMHDVTFGRSACLMCLFPERREGPGAAERLAEATGISVEVAGHGDRPLEEDDIVHLDERRRRALQPLVGKPICGLAEAIGLTDLAAEHYRPSVPFVSQQAACMVVGRLIAGLIDPEIPAVDFVQYDALIGPGAATLELRRPVTDCHCQVRAGVLESVRQARRV
jgi:hypothetical protein